MKISFIRALLLALALTIYSGESEGKSKRRNQTPTNANGVNKYCVDFETSMGKYDSYIAPFYTQALNDIHKWWQLSVSEEKPIQVFRFFEALYNKNRLDKVERNGATRIPKIFHQIWIGPKPFPEKYRKWQKTWSTVAGWQYKLWTNEDVANYPLINRDLFEKAANIGEKADILRMEILCKEGGVYIDTDFECLQPQAFDLLNESYDFYSGITPLDGKVLLIANGLIASVPGHPILRSYLENLKNAKTQKGCVGIVMKGPGFLTKMVLNNANKGFNDILLPPTFFYPLAIYPPKAKGVFSKKQGDLAHLMTSEEGMEEIKRIVSKPESVAIHWWEGAWVLEDGKVGC